jgi:hypothetical protein
MGGCTNFFVNNAIVAEIVDKLKTEIADPLVAFQHLEESLHRSRGEEACEESKRCEAHHHQDKADKEARDCRATWQCL